MKILIIVVFVLCGCIPMESPIPNDYHIVEKGAIHPDVLYIGDSLCYSTIDDNGLTAQQITGIGRDCKRGRSIVEYPDRLPSGYRIIFLALVTNSIWNDSPNDFRASLQRKLASTSTTVYCVLPTASVNGKSAIEYYNIMLEECTYTIDPMNYIQLPLALDGHHWTTRNHLDFSTAISERL